MLDSVMLVQTEYIYHLFYWWHKQALRELCWEYLIQTTGVFLVFSLLVLRMSLAFCLEGFSN